MEKGKIKTYGGMGGSGSISDDQGRVIDFISSSIMGRDRSGLKIGDPVWFERVGTQAINIRKC